MSIPFFC